MTQTLSPQILIQLLVPLPTLLWMPQQRRQYQTTLPHRHWPPTQPQKNALLPHLSRRAAPAARPESAPHEPVTSVTSCGPNATAGTRVHTARSLVLSVATSASRWNAAKRARPILNQPRRRRPRWPPPWPSQLRPRITASPSHPR